jgi:hypothetical protein
MEKKQETKTEEIIVGGINKKQLRLTLIGTSPLISHRFSERAVDKILAKQMKTAQKSTGRETKEPERDYKESLYILEDGRYGFPISAFKNSAVDAAPFLENLKKTSMRGSFHIVDENGGGLAVIENAKPRMRKDTVRLGGLGNPADIRFRGEFPIGWKVKLLIAYNANSVSPAQLVQLFNAAGFGVGVGDWRPQRDGSSGMFEVFSEK